MKGAKGPEEEQDVESREERVSMHREGRAGQKGTPQPLLCLTLGLSLKPFLSQRPQTNGTVFWSLPPLLVSIWVLFLGWWNNQMQQHFIISPFLVSWEHEQYVFLNGEQAMEANKDGQKGSHNHQVALATPQQDMKGKLAYPQVLLHCLFVLEDELSNLSPDSVLP